MSDHFFWKCPNCDFTDLPAEEANNKEKQQSAKRLFKHLETSNCLEQFGFKGTLEQYKKVRKAQMETGRTDRIGQGDKRYQRHNKRQDAARKVNARKAAQKEDIKERQKSINVAESNETEPSLSVKLTGNVGQNVGKDKKEADKNKSHLEKQIAHTEGWVVELSPCKPHLEKQIAHTQGWIVQLSPCKKMRLDNMKERQALFQHLDIDEENKEIAEERQLPGEMSQDPTLTEQSVNIDKIDKGTKEQFEEKANAGKEEVISHLALGMPPKKKDWKEDTEEIVIEIEEIAEERQLPGEISQDPTLTEQSLKIDKINKMDKGTKEQFEVKANAGVISQDPTLTEQSVKIDKIDKGTKEQFEVKANAGKEEKIMHLAFGMPPKKKDWKETEIEIEKIAEERQFPGEISQDPTLTESSVEIDKGRKEQFEEKANAAKEEVTKKKIWVRKDIFRPEVYEFKTSSQHK